MNITVLIVITLCSAIIALLTELPFFKVKKKLDATRKRLEDSADLLTEMLSETDQSHHSLLMIEGEQYAAKLILMIETDYPALTTVIDLDPLTGKERYRSRPRRVGRQNIDRTVYSKELASYSLVRAASRCKSYKSSSGEQHNMFGDEVLCY